MSPDCPRPRDQLSGLAVLVGQEASGSLLRSTTCLRTPPQKKGNPYIALIRKNMVCVCVCFFFFFWGGGGGVLKQIVEMPVRFRVDGWM